MKNNSSYEIWIFCTYVWGFVVEYPYIVDIVVGTNFVHGYFVQHLYICQLTWWWTKMVIFTLWKHFLISSSIFIIIFLWNSLSGTAFLMIVKLAAATVMITTVITVVIWRVDNLIMMSASRICSYDMPHVSLIVRGSKRISKFPSKPW